jgi:twinkle protein
MPKFLVDEIDFEAYLEATEFQAKVIPASDYADSVKKLLDPHAPKSDVPGLLLRKSRDLIKFGPAEVTFWAGYNGHRKSMFTSQVALDLAAQGQRVLIAIDWRKRPACTFMWWATAANLRLRMERTGFRPAMTCGEQAQLVTRHRMFTWFG